MYKSSEKLRIYDYLILLSAAADIADDGGIRTSDEYRTTEAEQNSNDPKYNNSTGKYQNIERL